MIEAAELERRKAICLKCPQLRTRNLSVTWCATRQIKPGGKVICLPWAANEYRKMLSNDKPNGGCPKWHEEKMSETTPRPRSATKLLAITTVYEGLDLLAHWLEHYKRLGVDEMLIGVGFRGDQDFVGGSDPLSNIVPSVISLCHDYPARVFPFKYEKYSCQLNLPLRRAMKQIAGVGLDDWCMHADLDEFYSFPCHVRELMWEMEDKNDWAVQGWILDRVAEDGTLPDIAPNVNLGEQFPYGCHLTGRFIGANTRKIMLCRGRVEVNAPHDTTRNARHSRKPIDGSYVAHHFRWTKALTSRVKRRIEENYVGKCYRRELLHLENYWREHQSLPLANPSLELRRVGPLLYPE